MICSTVVEWFQIKKSGLLYFFSDNENKYLISLNIIFKIKWLPRTLKFFCQKVLENSSMGTVQKGVRKFVNGNSAENYKYVNHIYGNNNRFYGNLG